MSAVTYWLFIVATAAAVVIAAWLSGLWSATTATSPIDTTKLITAAAQASSWSKPAAVPGDTRSACLAYTFQGTFSDGVLTPAAPVLSTTALDAIAPDAIVPSCYYPDQIVAKRLLRECKGGGAQGFPCRGVDGAQYTTGNFEQYYEQCKVELCKGDVAVVAVNFQPQQIDTAMCLTRSGPGAGAGSTVTTMPCDPSSALQLFVVRRESLVGVANQAAGPSGDIIDRSTGLCVIPNSTKTGLVLGGCPAPVTVTLQSGKKVQRSGAWLFADSYPYCPSGQFPGQPFGLAGQCYTNTPQAPVFAGSYASVAPAQIISATYTTGVPIKTPEDLFELSQLQFADMRAISATGTLVPYSKSSNNSVSAQVLNHYSYQFLIDNQNVGLGYQL